MCCALSGIASDRIRKTSGYQAGTVQSLLVKAQKSKSNTELLKTKLSEIVNTVLKEDITRDELSSLFELTTDYNLKMTYVVEDAFGRKMWRKFSRVMSEIDDLFEEYDRWQSQE